MNDFWSNSAIGLAVLAGIAKVLESVRDAILTYVNKKAENLATKTDIEEITRKVEGVKTELQYFNDIRTSLKNEERRAIIDHYEKFSLWLNLLQLNLRRYGIDNATDLMKKYDELEDAYHQVMLAEAKMRAYTWLDDYAVEAFDLNSLTCTLYGFAMDYIAKYYRTLADFIVRERFLDEKPVADRMAFYEEIGNARTKAVDDYDREFDKQYTLIHAKEVHLQSSIKKKLII